MTVALTSTIIMLGPRAADSNACTGTALPIDLSHRQCHPFQLWRLTQSCRTALEHRQCAPTNRLPLAAIKPPPTSTISEPLPLSPYGQPSRGFVQSGFYEVALSRPVLRARSPTRPHRTLKI